MWRMTSSTGNAGPAPDGHILIGRFGAVHGVRGEIRIKSFTADPMDLAGYGELRTRDGRRLKIARSRHVKDDMLVAAIAGIADRTAAEALVNQEIFISRDQLPPPEDDEFYLADLIGLEARLENGARFGVIRNVVNFGAGDILEVQPDVGEIALLAFTKAVVPVVKVSDGYVVVAPPAEIDGEDRG